MIPALVFIALLCAAFAGMQWAASTAAAVFDRRVRARSYRRSAVAWSVIALLLAFLPLARADNVAPTDAILEIPGVAKFTALRGDCPRLWRTAIAPNGMHGCYTMDEHTRAVTIRWPDGSGAYYLETQFNIYARDAR